MLASPAKQLRRSANPGRGEGGGKVFLGFFLDVGFFGVFFFGFFVVFFFLGGGVFFLTYFFVFLGCFLLGFLSFLFFFLCVWDVFLDVGFSIGPGWFSG